MKLKLFLTAGMLLLSTAAFAQFASGGSSSSSSSSDEIKAYNRIGVSYVSEKLSANKKYGDIIDDDVLGLSGFGVEYIHGFSLSNSRPLYLETGVKFHMGFNTCELDDDDWSVKTKLASATVPFNVTYKFPVAQDFSISPFVGINFKVNIIGKCTFADDYDSSDLNLFDKDDMGKHYTWNRFQMGWQIGVGLQYKPAYFGLSYGTDFIDAFKYKKEKVGSATFALTLGYCF